MTDKDKKEFVQDGLDPSRRKDFRMKGKVAGSHSRSLDEYIGYLQSIQKIFPFQRRIINKSLTNYKI